jgi:hypothetical protein
VGSVAIAGLDSVVVLEITKEAGDHNRHQAYHATH